MRLHWGVYVSIVGAALLLASCPGTEPYFEWVLGELNPVLAVLIAGIVGAVCLEVLRRIDGFQLLRRGTTMRGVAVGAGFATVLGIAIIVADLILRYPQDIDAPMPVALAFYPSVGFLAEIVFHILPLTLLLILMRPLRGRLGADRAVWTAIIAVAAAEPTFQAFFGGGSTALAVYTWIHVFAIAFLQLYVFRRYDFVSMYSFRLVYYAFWHVAWGVLRLELLF